MQKNKASFYGLTPHEVLDGVENAGLMPTGEYLQLNSYENRVFDIYLEPNRNPQELNNHVIVKFYRPERWSEKAILDEHFFLEELNLNGIPAIGPLQQKNGLTLSVQSHLWMALFPKGLGRLPQELTPEQRKQIGRLLARVHNVGAQKEAKARLHFDCEHYGFKTLDVLANWVAPEVWPRFEEASLKVLEFLEEWLEGKDYIRIHGDCHMGNLLQLDKKNEQKQFFLVDFDDFCNGPVEQDFWMLLSDTPTKAVTELEEVLAGYDEFRKAPKINVSALEALRALRMIYYSGWIARRFEDPTFPKLFPQFTDYNYWAQEVEQIEKIAWSL